MKDLSEYAGDRTALIDDLITELQERVTKAQEKLLRDLLAKTFDKLDVKDGVIQNTSANKRLLGSVDSVFNAFAGKDGLAILNTVVNGIDQIITFNTDYIIGISGDTQLADVAESMRATMNGWLGINEGGTIKANGYLDRIVTDASVRNEVKDLVVKNVVTQQGQTATRKALEDLITGAGDKAGALQQYTRNFVNDTYSVADRVVSNDFGTKAGFSCAVYEGGVIATTRPFCRKRNGNVYHRSEIAKMRPTSAIPPDYNPFTDMGGYACRHHWNWIPDALAIRMRSDIADLINSKDDNGE